VSAGDQQSGRRLGSARGEVRDLNGQIEVLCCQPYLANLNQKKPKFSPRSQAHGSIRSQEREPEKISHRSPQVLGLGAFLFVGTTKSAYTQAYASELSGVHRD
jgi:hypothetical protein